MYIPPPTQSQPRADNLTLSARSGLPGALVAAATSVIHRCLFSAPASLTRALSAGDHRTESAVLMPPPVRSLVRRDMSENQLRTIVAVTVAILLTAFIAASCTFMYLFRPTIRYRRRKPHPHHHNHHHHPHKLSGSRGSHGSGSVGDPPPPGPTPAPPPAPAD